jgi:hypothetical protein
VALGLAAATPSVAGAVLGAPLLLDDWGFAARSRYLSFSAGFGTQSRSRPLEGLWNWAEFRLFGTHPVPHLLILAALNAAAAVLFWRLLERWLPRRIAVVTALVWVVLPNRGSTHLWSTNSPHVFSLVMLLAALVAASGGSLTGPRLGTAVGLLVVGTLAYEGAIVLGVVGLMAIIWRNAPAERRVRWAGIVVGTMAAVGGWVLVSSPKRGQSPPAFRNLSHLASAHFGDAVLSSPVVALLVLVVITWCVVTVLLPAFRARAWPEQKLVVAGLAVILLGSAPFAVAGFPFSVSGFFDRGNLFADLGTALVYGSLLAMVLRLRWRAAAIGIVGVGMVGLALPNVESVRNYVRAGRDGRRFLAAVDALPAEVRTRGPVTFLPLLDHGGVAEFLADYDTSAALALRYHTGAPFPRAVMAVTATGFHGVNGPTYELVGHHLERR